MRRRPITVPHRSLYIQAAPFQKQLSPFEAFKKLGEDLGSALKFIVPAGFILGTLLLGGYLFSAGAPLILADTNSLLLLAVVFSVAFVILVLAFFMPSYTRIMGRGVIEQIDSEKASQGKWQLSIYATYYAPFIAYPVLMLFSGERTPGWVLLIPGFLGPFLLFLYLRYKRRIPIDAALEFSWFSFCASFLSFWWFLTVLLLVANHIQHSWQFRIAAVALLILHYVFTLLPAVGYLVRLVLVLFFFSLLSPGWAFLGGESLWSLGLGGNAPVTLLTKSMEEGADKTVAKARSGCLILATTSDVLLRPANSPKECKLYPNSLFETGPNNPQPRQPYDKVIRLARSDVIEFSKFVDRTTPSKSSAPAPKR